MPAIKHRTLGLLSGLAAALALLPASAHGASSCIQVATGLPMGAGQCAQPSASPVSQVSLQTSTTTQTAASEAAAKQDVSDAGLPDNPATPGSIPASSNNSAGRDASNKTEGSAANRAQTRQSDRQGKQGRRFSCSPGCGGNGQAQLSVEEAATTQKAES